jgi:septal ring factor EnvC (AmiA/AmiB activator)
MPDLTPDEILDILCALSIRIDILNDNMLLFVDKISEQLNFQDMEVLQTRISEMKYGQKIPKKRMESLEKSVELLSHELNIDSLKRELSSVSSYVSTISKKIITLEDSINKSKGTNSKYSNYE